MRSAAALISALALCCGTAACGTERAAQPTRTMANTPPTAPTPVPLQAPSADAAAPLDATPPPPPPDPGRANLDPEDDEVVGPPTPIADCEARLAQAGVSFKAAKLPLRTQPSGAQCGAEQVVIYEAGPAAIAWNVRPTVTCQMALGLSRFESILQEEAKAVLGSEVKRINQGGTYSCRKMARFALRSEHSYANAIDIYGVVLADGRTVTVKRHFGSLKEEPEAAESRFLRKVARRAFAEDVFSVVLTPFWDKLHHDHFHVDQARYRVNATSARAD
ncbi:MAG: extensin family protein [Polyangiaceae bacterium]